MVDGDFVFYSFRLFNNVFGDFIDKIIINPAQRLGAYAGQVKYKNMGVGWANKKRRDRKKRRKNKYTYKSRKK